MKSKIGIILVGGLMMLALSGIASASASAATPEWYVAGKSLSLKPAEGTTKAKEQPVKMSSVGSFEIKSPLWGITVECTSLSATGASIKSPGDGSATALAFSGCKMAAPAECKVQKTITTKAVSTEEFYVNSTEVWDEYKPTTGEVFVTIEIEGCALEGKYLVEGSFCSKETSPSSETVTKEQVFGAKPSGTGARSCYLEFPGTNPATVEGTGAFSLLGSQLGAVWTGK